MSDSVEPRTMSSLPMEVPTSAGEEPQPTSSEGDRADARGTLRPGSSKNDLKDGSQEPISPISDNESLSSISNDLKAGSLEPIPPISNNDLKDGSIKPIPPISNNDLKDGSLELIPPISNESLSSISNGPKDGSPEPIPPIPNNESLSLISNAAVLFGEESLTSSLPRETSLLTNSKPNSDNITAAQNSWLLESHDCNRRVMRYVNRTIICKTVPNTMGLFLELVCKKTDPKETYCNYLLKNKKPSKAFEGNWPFRHAKYLHASNAMNIPTTTLAKLIPAACRPLNDEQWDEKSARELERCLKVLLAKVSALKKSSNIDQVLRQDLIQQMEIEESLIDVLKSIEILCRKEEYSKVEKKISEQFQEVISSIVKVYTIMKELQINNTRHASLTWNQEYLEETFSGNFKDGQHTRPFYKIRLTKQVHDSTTTPCSMSCDQIIQTLQCSVNRNKSIVIEGVAGAGKSTLLLKMFHDFTYQVPTTGDSFPGIGKFDQAFYVDCRSDTSNNFSSFLDAHLHSSLKSKSEIKTIHIAYIEMKLLFLIDSFECFNEVSVQLVNNLFMTFRRDKHVFLIASRPLGWSTFLKSCEVDMPPDHDTYLINELSESEQESFLRLYEENTTINPSVADVNVIDRFQAVRESCTNHSPYVLPCFLTLFWHMLRYCPEKCFEWKTEFSILSQALTLCQTQLKRDDFIHQFGDLIFDHHRRKAPNHSRPDQKISTDFPRATNSPLDTMCVKKNLLWYKIFDDSVKQEQRNNNESLRRTDLEAAFSCGHSFVADVSARTQNQFLELLVAEALLKRLEENPETPVLELLPQHFTAEHVKMKMNKPRFSYRYVNILVLTIMGLLKQITPKTEKCLKNLFKVLDDAQMNFEFWAKIVSFSYGNLHEIKKHSHSEADLTEMGNTNCKTGEKISKEDLQAKGKRKMQVTIKKNKLNHDRVHDFVIQKAVGALAKPNSVSQAWVIRDSWQLPVTAQMLEHLVREAQPSALLVEIPDHRAQSSSQMFEFLKIMKRCYYGSFWLCLNQSYKYYAPCDNELQALQFEPNEDHQKKIKWRFKLWEFRGCINSKRAVQALASVVHRETNGGPQLSISLCQPLKHELAVLQGTPHSLTVKVRHEAMPVIRNVPTIDPKSKMCRGRLQKSRRCLDNPPSCLELFEDEVTGVAEINNSKSLLLSTYKLTPEMTLENVMGDDEIRREKSGGSYLAEKLPELTDIVDGNDKFSFFRRPLPLRDNRLQDLTDKLGTDEEMFRSFRRRLPPRDNHPHGLTDPLRTNQAKFNSSRRCSLPTGNHFRGLTNELRANEEMFSSFRKRPLPSGNRPPDLIVEDVPQDGIVAARALIRALAPNNKRFRNLRLERCGLSDGDLCQLWVDLFDKDGVRTTEGGRPQMTKRDARAAPYPRNVLLNLREDANCRKIESSKEPLSTEVCSDSSTSSSSSEVESNDDDS